MTPTANGYFSGAGAMEIGMMKSGIEFKQSLDIDPIATKCMIQNPRWFSHSVLCKDIKYTTVLDQKKADIIVGTYPCTKYSTIADIHGTRTGDELYLHFFRHMALWLPEAFVLENVPGMKKFPVVMEAMTKLPGYHINVREVDALTWLPQRRKRLIIFGTKRPLKIVKPSCGKAITIPQIIEHGTKVKLPDYVKSRISGQYRDKPIIVKADDPQAIAPTCVAHYSKDLSTRMVLDNGKLRPFTIREYARLQGFPDSYNFPDSGSAYRLIGNAVAVPVGEWVGRQLLRYFN